MNCTDGKTGDEKSKSRNYMQKFEKLMDNNQLKNENPGEGQPTTLGQEHKIRGR